jgi:hypothetical protein
MCPEERKTMKIIQTFTAILTLVASMSASSRGQVYDVSLKTCANTYVMNRNNGGFDVIGWAPRASTWEELRIIDLNGGALYHGDRVAIQANSGHYWCAEGAGGGAVNANRTRIQAWETFTILRQNGAGQVRPGDRIGLRSWGGWHVTARLDMPETRIMANVTWFSTWERFIVFTTHRAAIQWARARLGTNGGMNPYECLRFVRTAYGLSSSFANAHTAISVAQQKGILRGGSPVDAPRGAWMLYRWSSYGHAGIKTDGDRMIHLYTSSGQARVVENSVFQSGMTYAGHVKYEDLPRLLGFQ